MGDFINQAAAVAAIFSPVMRWIVMKKDKELPWAIRLLRWVLSACACVYAIGFVLHSLSEWFL